MNQLINLKRVDGRNVDQGVQGLAKEVEELGSSVFYSEGTNFRKKQDWRSGGWRNRS